MNKILILLPLLFFIPIYADAVEWHDADYKSSRLITIPPQAGQDNFDAVIYMNVTFLDLGVDTQADCDDIIWVVGDNAEPANDRQINSPSNPSPLVNVTVLPHEIETCDTVNDIYEVRVRKLMPASFNTFVYMYYNNPSAVDSQNATGVYFDAQRGGSAPDPTNNVRNMEWYMVHHFNGTFIDSTGRGNDAVNSGTVANTTGHLGQSITFDGINDNIEIATSSTLDNVFDYYNSSITACFTGDICGGGRVSFWFNHPNATVDNSGTLLSKTDGTSGWEILYENGKLAFRQYTLVGEGLWELDYNPTNSTWHYFSLFFNDDEVAKDPSITIDQTLNEVGSGLTEVTTPTGEYSEDTGIDLCVGNTHTDATTCATGASYKGEIDELVFDRVSGNGRARTALPSQHSVCESPDFYDGVGGLTGGAGCIWTFGAEASIPDQPTNLVSSAPAYNQVVLSWDAPVDVGTGTISGYLIERESPVGGGFSTLIADTGTTDTVFDDFNVAASAQYSYRVSAITEVFNGLASAAALVFTPDDPNAGGGGGGSGGGESVETSLSSIGEFFNLSIFATRHIGVLGQTIPDQPLEVKWSSPMSITIIDVSSDSSPFRLNFQNTPFILPGNPSGDSSGNILYSIKIPDNVCQEVQTDDCIFNKAYEIPVTVVVEHDGDVAPRNVTIRIDFTGDVDFVSVGIIGFIAVIGGGYAFTRVNQKKRP